jgi:hypothetical protein
MPKMINEITQTNLEHGDDAKLSGFVKQAELIYTESLLKQESLQKKDARK